MLEGPDGGADWVLLYERSNPPVRGAGGFAVSGGRTGSKVGAPHCPQNASSRLNSFPHLGHLSAVLLLLLRLLNCYALGRQRSSRYFSCKNASALL